MEVKAFYDDRTSTLTYAVYDPSSRDAVVIDSVLDYDPLPSSTSTESADRLIAFLEEHGLKLHYILETHAHADHLSASQVLKEHFGEAQVAVGARIVEVQVTFKKLLDLPEDFATDGSQFDRLLKDGETIEAGTLAFETIFTPGHTPACVTYRIGDMLFTGDAIFMPDFGTGRCDFPAGSAREMYRSVTERLYAFPDQTRVFVGHDYQPGGRALEYECTIGREKQGNVQLPASRGEEEFIKFRTERDKTISLPKLIFQSIQVNVNAGRLPEPGSNNIRYLKIPLNLFAS